MPRKLRASAVEAQSILLRDPTIVWLFKRTKVKKVALAQFIMFSFNLINK